MAGHSHSANIKRRKEAGDAKRGQVFSKMARAIMNAARTGGGDPDANISLKYAIDRAKAVSMPRDNIDRAIKKGTGELEGGSLDACTYEAIAPGGVFIVIEALTDNRNRTAPEVRKILESKNARLGSVGWAFEKKGLVTVAADADAEDDVLEVALAAGAEDMQRTADRFVVTCAPNELNALRDALVQRGFAVEDAELSLVPKTLVKVDADACRQMLDLFDRLDDHDDVQNVYSNLDVPEALLTEAS